MRKEANDLIEGKTKVIKNKHISAYAQSEIDSLRQQVLELTMENAELKDKLIDAGEYAKTDGYEVGSPSDYKWDKQLNLDFEVNKISDNDFEVREQFNRECD
tara:strand:- start:931 stop:1236 length:306 start_codon:yes stop_codon:yes gene_type:complete